MPPRSIFHYLRCYTAAAAVNYWLIFKPFCSPCFSPYEPKPYSALLCYIQLSPLQSVALPPPTSRRRQQERSFPHTPLTPLTPLLLLLIPSFFTEDFVIRHWVVCCAPIEDFREWLSILLNWYTKFLQNVLQMLLCIDMIHILPYYW